MDVYLMQHGAPVPEAENPDRRLSASGRDDVERVAARAARAGVVVDVIAHSGKLRAEQSAALLGNALGAANRIEVRGGLAPNDPVRPVADWLASEAAQGAGAVAIVGHLPFLDRLAALLVCGREDVQVVEFRRGGLVRLVPNRDGTGYAVSWLLPPDLATA